MTEYFDMHVHSAFSEGGQSSLEELASRAKSLGFCGLCFTEYFKNKGQIKELQEKLAKTSKQIGIKIFLAFEATTPKELAKLTDMRKEYDLLLVRGFDLGLNRMAVETPEVDVLTHPEMARRDSGFNHVMAKEAAKNNVAIELNFRNILLTDKNSRALTMQNMAKNLRLCKKFHTPVVICSGAISHWQLRDPKILMSMGKLLGMNLDEAKQAISDIPTKMVAASKERRSGKWIMPGVKEV